MKHINIIEEYAFVKKKVKKLVAKAKLASSLPALRLKKKIKQLLRRLRKIEDICKQLGYAHPLTLIGEEKQFNQRDLEALQSHNPHVYTPDGMLPGKTATYLLPTVESLSITNPDGTLFETPALDGAFVPRRKITD